jgi:hypothetical protein
VGKRSFRQMDTVNAKKRWTTINWRVNKFLKKSHKVTRLTREQASYLKINDISFFCNAWQTSFLFYSVSGNANSMVSTNPGFLIHILIWRTSFSCATISEFGRSTLLNYTYHYRNTGVNISTKTIFILNFWHVSN